MRRINRLFILLTVTLLYGMIAGGSEVSADSSFDHGTLTPVVTSAPDDFVKPTMDPDYIPKPLPTLAPNSSPIGPTFDPVITPIPTYAPMITPIPVQTQSPYSEYYRQTALKMDIKKADLNVKRVSEKKVKLTWDRVADADGYLISYSLKEKGSYTKLKYIDDPQKTSCTIKRLKSKNIYYYKMAAYQIREGIRYYSYYSQPEQAETYKTQKIYNKIMNIKQGYPQGMYWNHVGYKNTSGNNSSGYVTFKPCKHAKSTATCNRYRGRDGILGIQCYGFASYVSDTLFKNAKYKHHKSFKKAKVGDHVRYNNDRHSVVIMEKHKDYIVVCEVNYGGTCMINWGRKITKQYLSGATYHTRY